MFELSGIMKQNTGSPLYLPYPWSAFTLKISSRFQFVFLLTSSDLVQREASSRSDTDSMKAATAASE